MDIGSITAAISSLKAAKDIAQAMLDLKSLSDVQSKVIELQRQILSAQSSALDAQAEQFDLKKLLSDLEQEVSRLKTWEQEKKRYELKSVDTDTFVYALKPPAASGEPAHWLCCNCFYQGSKSILQMQSETYGTRIYKCHKCASEIMTGKANEAPAIRYPNNGYA